MLLLLVCALFQQSPRPVATFLKSLEALSLDERHAAAEEFFSDQLTLPIIEQDSVVWFLYHGPAQRVQITGDLQQAWTAPEPLTKISCGDEGIFYNRYVIPPDARLNYRFIVDGKEITDPLNPWIAPSGFGDHSELRMPGFTSSPLLEENTDNPAGTLDTLRFTSRNPLIRPRSVVVYLPPGYNETDWYPTIYVHDGLDAIDFAFYPRVLDNLIATKAITSLVAVFIPPVERSDEYLRGKHVEYGDAVCDEIVPLIDAAYRTSLRPEDRLMMGISNGGHLSLTTVLRHPEVFLNAAGQSSTPSDDLFFRIRQALQGETSRPGFRLYVDVGRYDIVGGGDWTFLSGNRALHNVLLEYDQPHVYQEFNDGHQWANWRERTPEILRTFFPPSHARQER